MSQTKNENPTREKILAAALRLFRRQGYNGVGINTLCREAGVVKGSFYHFFPSKQALLDMVIDRNTQRVIENLKSAAATGADGRGRLLAQFSAVLSSAASQNQEDGHVLGCGLGTLASELATVNESARVASATAFRQWHSLLEDLVRAGVEDGSIAQSVDPAPTALSLLAVIQGMSTLGRSFNDPDTLTSIAQTTVKRLLPMRAH